MLSLLFTRKREKSLEEIAVLIQQGDEKLLESTMANYRPFIKKSASAVCKRYIDQSDDEFSIGLLAFHDALMKYDTTKGSSLLAFADVLIKRKIIDYIRQQARHDSVSLDQTLLASDEESNVYKIENALSVKQFEQEQIAQARKEEIILYKQSLSHYGLTFADLIDQSPKHEDARIGAMEIARIIVADEKMLSHLHAKKRLPIKEIEGKVSVSRKTIERNRKYIVAICLILSGDYLYLREYIKGRSKP